MDEKKQIEKLREFIRCMDGSTYRGGPIRVVNHNALAIAIYNEGYRKQSEGEWIKQTKKTTSSVKGNEVEYHVNFCSECGYEIGCISYNHKFCQNCRARMKNTGWRDDAEAETKGARDES